METITNPTTPTPDPSLLIPASTRLAKAMIELITPQIHAAVNDYVDAMNLELGEMDDDDRRALARQIDLRALAQELDYPMISRELDHEAIAGHVDISRLDLDIDYNDLANEVEYYSLARELDYGDLALEVDMDDLASNISIDYDDLAASLIDRVIRQPERFAQAIDRLWSQWNERRREQRNQVEQLKDKVNEQASELAKANTTIQTLELALEGCRAQGTGPAEPAPILDQTEEA